MSADRIRVASAFPVRRVSMQTHTLAYEHPLEDPDYPGAGSAQTDRLSYRPGEVVRFHVSSSAPTFSLTIIRDGATPSTVEHVQKLEAPLTPLKPGFIENGCDWPQVYRWKVRENASSGFSSIASTLTENSFGTPRVQEHGFFVLPKSGKGAERSRISLSEQRAPGLRITTGAALITTTATRCQTGWSSRHGSRSIARGRAD